MYADFVAKVKVTKSLKEWNFENAFNPYSISFTIEELFKGEEITSISLSSYSDASCGLVISENSEWIIFAYKNNDNHYFTDLCSGSKQIDLVFTDSIYPNATKNHNLMINNTLEVLKLFKKYNVEISNKILLSNSKDNFSEHFNKYNACDFLNQYGVYKVILNADLSIKEVISIKGYSDEFDKGLKKIIKEKAKFIKYNRENRSSVPQDTEWLLLIKGVQYGEQPCYFNQNIYL
ncbi:MAG: hypothetical protein IM568_09905 [Flavobacterium sp.]|nr:hypothetical protein [Flavobacterium sp.]